MGLGELNKAGVIVVGFGKKHEPETIIEPYFPNQRHPSLLKLQIPAAVILRSHRPQ